jgi:hypothetical protein
LIEIREVKPMKLTDERLGKMIDAIYEEIKKKMPQIASLNIEFLVKNLIILYILIEKLNVINKIKSLILILK